MILLIDDKVIGEVNKVNFHSSLDNRCINLITGFDDTKLFFEEWLDFYSKQPANVFDEKTLYIYDDISKEIVVIKDAYIKDILKSHTDCFGKVFKNMFEIHLFYKDYDEKKLRNDSEFYSNIYKSYLRDKKINQIIN
jgi:hypothetical protein